MRNAIVSIGESSLPDDLLRVWEKQNVFLEGDGSSVRHSRLMRFLQSEVGSEQRIDIAVGGFSVSSAKQNNRQEKGAVHSEGVSINSEWNCVMETISV